MKNIQEIRKEIIESMQLDDVNRAVQILNDVYQMPAILAEEGVHLVEEDVTFSHEAFKTMMEMVVGQAPMSELRDNYQLLTGDEWQWCMLSEEQDEMPELILVRRNNS